MFKHRHELSADDLGLLAVGLVAAFLSAFVCVRWLLRYIIRHDFTIFAWYRIAFGLIVGAVAVAVALAFGLGGREAASKQIAEWSGTLKAEDTAPPSSMTPPPTPML